MAELQRLLQTINGHGKQSFLPSNFMQDKIEAAIQIKKESMGADSDSGYSSYSCDTPTSAKSHSPMGHASANQQCGMNVGGMKPPSSVVVVKTEPNNLSPCGSSVVNATNQMAGLTVMNGVAHPANQSPTNGHMTNGTVSYQGHGVPNQGHGHPNQVQHDPGVSAQGHNVPNQGHSVPNHGYNIQNYSPPQVKTEPSLMQTSCAGANMLPPKIERGLGADCMGGMNPVPPGMEGMMEAGFMDMEGMAASMQFMMEAPIPGILPSAETIENMVRDGRIVPSEERQQLINQVLDSVIPAHMDTCNYTVEKVQEGLRHFQERQRTNPTPPMPMPDMSKMAANSSMLWQKFVASMVPVITRVIRFCKRLPGFLELSENDQIMLIKQGSFEVILVRYLRIIDVEKGYMYDPPMETQIRRDLLRKMPMGELMSEMFTYAAETNPLHLTDAETGLLTAVLIINPERQNISNKRAISKLRILFLQSLYAEMKRARPDNYEDIFVKTIYTLPTLAKINDTHAKALNSMKMASPNNFAQLPQIHTEIFTDSA